MGEHLGRRRKGEELVGEEWRVLKADWTIGGSHLGGLQHLDGLVGAGALIMFSSDHTVVGPDRRQEAGLQKHINGFIRN